MPVGRQSRIWDRGVRLFHWSLVVAVGLALVSEDEWMDLHLGAGLSVLGLLGWRLVWGQLGPRHARFEDFAPGPRRLLRYLGSIGRGRPIRHLGHNPAGGAMVLALLFLLLAQVFSGLLYWWGAGAGPGSPGLLLSPLTLQRLQSLHGLLADALVWLIGLHLLGVILASLQHRENLILAMITGRKRGPAGRPGSAPIERIRAAPGPPVDSPAGRRRCQVHPDSGAPESPR